MKQHHISYFVWDFWTDKREEFFYLLYESYDTTTSENTLRLITIEIKS